MMHLLLKIKNGTSNKCRNHTAGRECRCASAVWQKMRKDHAFVTQNQKWHNVVLFVRMPIRDKTHYAERECKGIHFLTKFEDVLGFKFTTRPTCPTHYDVADQWFTRPQFFFTTSTFKSNLRTHSTRYPIPQFFWRSCKINCMFILYFLYFSR